MTLIKELFSIDLLKVPPYLFITVQPPFSLPPFLNVPPAGLTPNNDGGQSGNNGVIPLKGVAMMMMKFAIISQTVAPNSKLSH